jgi:hypothetical protein
MLLPSSSSSAKLFSTKQIGNVLFANILRPSKFDVQSERKGEWGVVPDFEAEVNGDSMRGIPWVGSLGQGGARDFCPALAVVVSPVQNIFFLNGHFFSGFVSIVGTGRKCLSLNK